MPLATQPHGFWLTVWGLAILAALAYWVADDYLRCVALALLGWAWVQIRNAQEQDDPPAGHASRWLAPAEAMRRWVMPEFDMRLSIIAERIATNAVPAPRTP